MELIKSEALVVFGKMRFRKRSLANGRLKFFTNLSLEVQAVKHFLQCQNFLVHQDTILVTLICKGEESRSRIITTGESLLFPKVPIEIQPQTSPGQDQGPRLSETKWAPSISIKVQSGNVLILPGKNSSQECIGTPYLSI